MSSTCPKALGKPIVRAIAATPRILDGIAKARSEFQIFVTSIKHPLNCNNTSRSCRFPRGRSNILYGLSQILAACSGIQVPKCYCSTTLNGLINDRQHAVASIGTTATTTLQLYISGNKEAHQPGISQGEHRIHTTALQYCIIYICGD
jgi:hypothetical protein